MRRVTMLVIALVLAGCAAPVVSGPTAELHAARETWAALGATDYRFTIRRDCYCVEDWIGPFTISFLDGARVVTRDGAPVDPAILEDLPLDADALFAFAAERIDQAGYRAQFDSASGFPLAIWSDPIPEAADDELGLTISDLIVGQ